MVSLQSNSTLDELIQRILVFRPQTESEAFICPGEKWSVDVLRHLFDEAQKLFKQ